MSQSRGGASEGRFPPSAAHRMRQRRAELRLTLQALADRVGVTRSYLSQIENGKTTPSIEVLAKVSRALGEPVRDLVEARDDDASGRLAVGQEARVVRAGARKRIQYPGSHPLELLTPDVQLKMEVTLAAADDHNWREVPRIGQVTEEFAFVIEGTFEMRIGDVVHELSEGDSMYLAPALSYAVRSVGDAPGRCLWIASPPVF